MPARAVRGYLVSVALTLGACAQASPTAGPADAPPVVTDVHVDGPAPDAPPPRDAAIDAPPPPIDAMVNPCVNPAATCANAIDLGSISGDTLANQKTASGHRAAWYRVRVTEDDSDVFGIKLSMTARLTSPQNVDFDVFVYVNTATDVVECNTPSGTPSTSGLVDQQYLLWGEGAFSNGTDDGRTVSIEVRPVSGTCDAGQPWQLQLVGNT